MHNSTGVHHSGGSEAMRWAQFLRAALLPVAVFTPEGRLQDADDSDRPAGCRGFAACLSVE